GLASGFIEPLESTGIWFIELALRDLALNFPDREFNPHVIAKYNALMRAAYEHVRDFIVLHYCTTGREDSPFWRANKHHAAIPATLQESLALWEAMLPNHAAWRPHILFPEFSYACVLAGMGRLPAQPLPLLRGLDERLVEHELAVIRENAPRLTATQHANFAYLAGLREDGVPTATSRAAAASPGSPPPWQVHAVTATTVEASRRRPLGVRPDTRLTAAQLRSLQILE